MGESAPCLVLLASGALAAIFGIPCLLLHHLALCLYLPIFTSSCVCLSLCWDFPFFMRTPVILDENPAEWPHCNLLTSVKNLLPYKVTFWDKGARTPKYFGVGGGRMQFNAQERDFEINCCCCSVPQSCPTLCDPMDCSTPGFPVLHHLPELAQTHAR